MKGSLRPDDRKMFAPLRRRSPLSAEDALASVLGGYEAGATAAALATDLVAGGFAVGTRTTVAQRVADLLGEMEAAGTVTRIRDGRYRVVQSAPRS